MTAGIDLLVFPTYLKRFELLLNLSFCNVMPIDSVLLLLDEHADFWHRLFLQFRLAINHRVCYMWPGSSISFGWWSRSVDLSRSIVICGTLWRCLFLADGICAIITMFELEGCYTKKDYRIMEFDSKSSACKLSTDSRNDLIN